MLILMMNDMDAIYIALFKRLHHIMYAANGTIYCTPLDGVRSQTDYGINPDPTYDADYGRREVILVADMIEINSISDSSVVINQSIGE